MFCMCFAAVLISSQVSQQTPSPPGTCPSAVFINFSLVFVWIFRWWWSGRCSHYSCLRMWWTTICRCRVSDHLGTDPYATFVVMSILSERCHLVFTEAGRKAGVYVLLLRCEKKNEHFPLPLGTEHQLLCSLRQIFSKLIPLLLQVFFFFLSERNVKKPFTLYGVGLGCELSRRKRR